MTPDQEVLKITAAWGCGGDSGAIAMVRAVLISERERCAKIAEDFARANINLNPNEDEATVASSVAQAIANMIRAQSGHG